MAAPKILDCAGKPLDLSQPRVMGILNLTPDSFSDGGRFTARDAAIRHALQMIKEGAAMVDIGGESTRPGAQPVTAQQEMDRVIPLIEALAGEIEVPISVDTSKAEVMREAVSAGAGMINDVMALRDSGALQAAAEAAVPVCLMHMQGEPRTMQCNPHYDDVVEDVKTFLQQRLDACLASGIPQDRLIVDPGFGFGKTLSHNLALLDNLQDLEQLGVPVLVGISRKSMIGTLLGDRAVEERLYGSLAAAVMAAMKGSAILRVHDVRATADALKIVSAVQAVDPECR
ncbi:MAG: dihydropteroate synthase [Candidatus Thiodiazotropha taylori]|uniref:Dihydropteroate synthase n=1 Tax=Candidatus Thiodiazotropha taylori TaxID=2792791 RepID=A0A9E4N4X4_9GAMM|nr:dihydropteroate synthase [Candidatus Thiodiazotropha taylori]MCG7955364.1 dihydropteroate synthase [Candidatus Thiodiazotropha taylori]MCG7968682.1 dihydropteroate synthase [Candidatus Thiodiazotropha taylori]MCW4240734.1 dihydropteroate synthase [Candidatus Thiodiazotropha taylori]MCW4256945.1 dihydropteroate synthase [Candidatus Thiodiazotropha taylori]